MAEFKECIDVMKRIEGAAGTTDGRMMVKGTTLTMGEEIIHSSLDNTTSVALSRALIPFTEACNNFVRTLDPKDNVEYLRINFKASDSHTEIMVGPEDDFQAIVVQEHPIRDLRKRSAKQQKNMKGYRHVQLNPFYPSIEG